MNKFIYETSTLLYIIEDDTDLKSVFKDILDYDNIKCITENAAEYFFNRFLKNIKKYKFLSYKLGREDEQLTYFINIYSYCESSHSKLVEYKAALKISKDLARHIYYNQKNYIICFKFFYYP